MTPTTIAEAVDLLCKGDFSPVELVDETLAAIKSLNPQVNGFINIAEEHARERALEIKNNWNKYKDKKLPGVPVGIKDMILKKGLKCTAGSKILENFEATFDATVVERLEQEGAIIVGKCNQDEFAMGSSNEHSAFGSTKNPWALDCIPGGSSGGSAAVVASGQVLGSLGTDTGGSIRQPAAMCGVCGLKPTYGRVSRYGVIAFASSLDQVGPFARTVEDLSLLTGIISGRDERDSTTPENPVPDYVGSLEESLKGKTIGVPEDLLSLGLDKEVETSFRESLEVFKGLGCQLKSIQLPHSQYGIAVYYIIATSEASSNLARYDGVRYGHRADNVEKLKDLYAQTRTEGFGAEVKFRIMMGNFSLSSGYYDAYYRKASQVRRLIQEDFQKAFQACDIVATPTTPTAAFKIGEKIEDPMQMYLSDIFTVSANLAGICGLSLPCGMSKEKKPVGLQLLGPEFGELSLFQFGHAYQKETKWHEAKPRLWGAS